MKWSEELQEYKCILLQNEKLHQMEPFHRSSEAHLQKKKEAPYKHFNGRNSFSEKNYTP